MQSTQESDSGGGEVRGRGGGVALLQQTQDRKDTRRRSVQMKELKGTRGGEQIPDR